MTEPTNQTAIDCASRAIGMTIRDICGLIDACDFTLGAIDDLISCLKEDIAESCAGLQDHQTEDLALDEKDRLANWEAVRTRLTKHLPPRKD